MSNHDQWEAREEYIYARAAQMAKDADLVRDCKADIFYNMDAQAIQSACMILDDPSLTWNEMPANVRLAIYRMADVVMAAVREEMERVAREEEDRADALSHADAAEARAA